MTRGMLTLIVGTMFANKTGTLIHRIQTLRIFGKKRVLIFKPTIDTRSGKGKIKSTPSDGPSIELEALEIPDSDPFSIINEIKNQENEIGTRINVIAIDEIQFFPACSDLIKVVDFLLENSYDVIAAGLLRDFKREPFGSTPLLFSLLDDKTNIVPLFSFCAKCGKPAFLPQRLDEDGKPAPYDSPQIKVGGRESYEARCHKCHILPKRPRLPHEQ